jgi:hypothetical protein
MQADLKDRQNDMQENAKQQIKNAVDKKVYMGGSQNFDEN